MTWSVSEAKARLSEVLAKARKAPQLIESRGEPVAVVLSKDEFDRLRSLEATRRPTELARLIEFTDQLKAKGDLEMKLPPRALERERPTPFAPED